MTSTKNKQLTGLLEKAKVPRKFQRLAIESVDVRYIGELSTRGSGLYIRVPKEIVDYFDLMAGDKVKIAILQRKKWSELEEAD